MGLNYSIAMLKNPQNQDESAKAYAKSQITGELSLKELSRRVAAQTTASRADVTAVIIATAVSYTHLDVYKRQTIHIPSAIVVHHTAKAALVFQLFQQKVR